MADILIASSASPAVTRDEIEAAHSCIDNASFRVLEKLLGLKSPDIQFQHAILEAIALYRRNPDPSSLDRKNLKALRKYLSDVLQHLHELEQLLLPSGKHAVVLSNFLLSILEHKATSTRRFQGYDFLEFRTAL